jgi:hypothetical protein
MEIPPGATGPLRGAVPAPEEALNTDTDVAVSADSDEEEEDLSNLTIRERAERATRHLVRKITSFLVLILFIQMIVNIDC